MTTTDRSGIAQRIDAMAATATPTPNGMRLDLRIYVYPNGGGALTARDRDAASTTRDYNPLVTDDLELLSEIALVIRRVRQAQAKEVKS